MIFLCKKGGKESSRETLSEMNIILMLRKSIKYYFFSLSLFFYLFLSNVFVLSTSFTKRSSYGFEWGPDIFSMIIFPKLPEKMWFHHRHKKRNRVFEKRSLGPRVDRRKEFLKLDNRRLMNATLGLVQLKCISECDGIFVGIVFSQFVLLTHYLICFSEKGAYVKI